MARRPSSVDDKHLRPYDLDTGQIGEPWPPLFENDYAPEVVSSADGRFWLSSPTGSTAETDIGVHDTQSHELVTGPSTCHILADNATFSPDGTRLYLSGGMDGDVMHSRFQTATRSVTSTGCPRPDSTFEWTTAGLAFVEGDLLAVGSTPERYVSSIPQHSRTSARSSSRRGNRTYSRHSTVGGAFSVRGRRGGSDGISGHRAQSGTSMRRRSLATR